jgi:magnesium transporter
MCHAVCSGNRVAAGIGASGAIPALTRRDLGYVSHSVKEKNQERRFADGRPDPVIHFHLAQGNILQPVPVPADGAIPDPVVWIDLCEPTMAEETRLEHRLGLDIPTREEMSEIESTSRLYRENGALFMTAVLLCRSDTHDPTTTPITFIVTADRLITVRYDTPQSFKLFIARCERRQLPIHNNRDVLLGLLNTIVDRAADILERVGADLESLSREIFRHTGAQAHGRIQPRRDLQDIVEDVGRSHDVLFKIRESVQSLERLLYFLRANTTPASGNEMERVVKDLEQDVRSLGDYNGYLSAKVNFMLEATLGLVGIQQNAIIKIFSVVAVIFMPPTMIASIYGMNFEHMPELHWLLGYPWALGLMIVSGILPYLFFKWRGWL